MARAAVGTRRSGTSTATKGTADAPRPRAEYFVLDMGREQYGDSILCRFGEKTILIDGGHPSDYSGQPNYDSIPDQLATILRTSPPFKLTLLVVTHAHNDHIGCLPKMISAGTIEPEFAIVADPDLGFPHGYRDFVEGLDTLDPDSASAVQRAVAAISEEDHSFLPDSELDAFLDAASTLGVRYRDMLGLLEDTGTTIFKWGTSDPAELQPIYQALAGTGFDIIGPSLPHLQVCTQQIKDYARDVRDQLISLVDRTRTDSPGAAISATALYRAAQRKAVSGDVLIDRRGQGSALNCQSIVLKFGSGEEKVLLAGDMQFADHEVGDLDVEMENLRNKIVAEGPYKFVKLTHHTSYNGIDKEFWEELGKPPLLVHSGGLNDDKHPEPGALDALKNLGRQIVFARTDRNGQIMVDPSKEGRNAFRISRGRLNDFTPNPSDRDLPAAVPPPPVQPKPVLPSPSKPQPVAAQPSFVEVTFVRIPFQDSRVSIDGRVIEISGRGGLERRSDPPPPPPLQEQPTARSGALAGGRDMSKLLFVTDAGKLENNIGELEAQRAIRLITDAAKCIRIDGIDPPETAVRRDLESGNYAGVVILGGYDVVPSQRVDVLDAGLRASIPRSAIVEDRDEFIVWSDDMWGDVDGGGMPDFPVSRIPDARTASLLIKALQAKKPAATGRFGMRNVLRPFAGPIFNLLPGGDAMLQSAPTRFDQIPSGATERPYLYFMLHGLDRDSSRFWGENPGRGAIEAINVSQLPKDGLGVALAGCCWGALTVDQRANERTALVSPKAPGSSIALSVLAGGAQAFVGCTGVHYSPDDGGDFFGGPMQNLFWKELLERGRSPAQALFEARKQFLAAMPHGRDIPLELGIERKIYKQFTCLGLGW
jgi:beta-lactamase superfamily II metal-dependent hydrolase